MNDKKDRDSNRPKNIKVELGGEYPFTVLTEDGKRFELSLEDSLPITAGVSPSEIEKQTLHATDRTEAEGLVTCFKIIKGGNKYSLLVHYQGVKGTHNKIYKDTLDRQACLLWFLCDSEDKEISIDSAYRVLEDGTRCRHPYRGWGDKPTAVHEVVKNLRKEVGFTPDELYISKRTSTVGLKSVQ